MKRILFYIPLFCLLSVLLVSCDKHEHEYPMGLEEYEHHYYAAYIPNNNSKVTATRNQATPLKFPVQFYSAFKRDYDAVAYYSVVTTGMASPAILGVDFNIVDKNGNVLQPVADKFTFMFPRAERAMDTIYVQLLNNPAPGTRTMEIQIVENKTEQYYVDIFSTAFRRPVDIK